MKLAETLETDFLDLIGFDENKLFIKKTSQDTSNITHIIRKITHKINL